MTAPENLTPEQLLQWGKDLDAKEAHKARQKARKAAERQASKPSKSSK